MQNMQNQSMHFVLSTDAKPRLKWTPELHQRFIEATNQLGGAESKYKPNSISLLFRSYTWCLLECGSIKSLTGVSVELTARYNTKYNDGISVRYLVDS